jgi:3-oxoacyl-[acyl-carrier-protein] synthase-1
VHEIAAALREGRHGLVACPVEVPFETVVGWVAGELPEMPPGCGHQASRLARVALLAYEGVADGVRAARSRWGADRVAMIMSTSTGGIAETEAAYFAWRDTGSLPPGYDFTGQHEFAAFTDALRVVSGISGPRYVVSTACSSSAKVFASAQRLIEADVVDAALVGGVDVLSLTTLRGFHSLGVLATGPCRPFAAERPGMNIGEGAAFVLVERAGDAPARLLGVGESSDAFHMSAPHPEGRGAFDAMEAALRAARFEPDRVEHVNAHGTGTAANDVTEACAIAEVFGDRVPVTSTKSYTGHTLAAAGATEAVLALECMIGRFVPQNLRLDEKDANVPVSLPTARIDREVNCVISNSFAFGGSNASVLFGGPGS